MNEWTHGRQQKIWNGSCKPARSSWGNFLDRRQQIEALNVDFVLEIVKCWLSKVWPVEALTVSRTLWKVCHRCLSFHICALGYNCLWWKWSAGHDCSPGFSTTILLKTDFYTKSIGMNFKQGGLNGKPLQNLDFKQLWATPFKRPVENTGLERVGA
jgi:hypothetical protein